MESQNELEEEEGGVGISFLIQLCWKKNQFLIQPIKSKLQNN
jgi:hypothetical protein